MSFQLARRGVWCLGLYLALAAPAAPVAAYDVLVGNAAAPRISVLGDAGQLKDVLAPPSNLGFTNTRAPRLGADGRIYVGTNGALYRLDGSTGAFVDVFVSGLPGIVLFNVGAPDGNLWLSLGSGGKVVHVNGSTGAQIGEIGPLSNPIGLAIGPDGYLYVGTGSQVTRYDSSTGALIGPFASLTASGVNINGMSFGPDGDLYAALSSNDVERIDGTTGADEGSFIRAGDPKPANPRGPSWGPDGNLWVSENTNGNLLRYDATGAFLGVFGAGIESPGAAAFVPDMSPMIGVDLLVSNPGSGQITQIDGATGLPEGIFALPGADGLVAAAGLRLGSDGRLNVGSSQSVYRFDASTGAFIDKLGTGLPSGTGYFVARAADGSLFVNAFPRNELVRFDTATPPTPSYIGGAPLVPTGLDIGPDGNLYVGDFAGNQVKRFDPTTGVDLGVFCTIPIAGTQGAAGATRFGPDGRLYVALFNGADVIRCDGTTGAFLGSFIPPGDVHPTGPSHLVWGPDGNLYVASSGSGEVLRYDGTTGAFLGVFASGFGALWGLEFVPALTPPYPPCLTPTVPTTSGPVLGFCEGGVRKYLGVPYAEAPTGNRRWRRPARKAPSTTVIHAFSHGPQCPQPSGGSEDCLKLSIWRPDAPPATPLPVLFFIHGGGLWSGAIGPVIDGTAFARMQNAIVVETQYRLGALGFLGLPQLAAEDANGSTGNYGFLDQLEALRWVRDNIAAFGGDPNQVTIAGSSAGGWSVCALLASPLSDGLFRAGIVQSGSCGNARPLTLPAGSPVLSDPLFGDTILERGDRVVANTGCPDDAEKLTCLRSLPASSLVQAYTGYADATPRVNRVDQPVNPALDGYVLSEQPVVMLRQGAADGRALMISSTANESTYFSQTWDSIITTPAIYETFLRAAAGNTRADALLPLYPAASYTPIADAFRTLIDDSTFTCSTLDAADAATEGGSPSFVYHLTFSPTWPPMHPNAGLRTFHGLDLYYVFGTYARLTSDYGIIVGPNDAALSESLQDAWGSFVRTGAPVTTPAWPQYAPSSPGDLASVSVLQFDVPNTVVPGTSFRSGRCAALFPVANQLDADRDVATYEEDNCPVTANTDQADSENDLVGDVCDNCANVSNPRVAADFLANNPWATLTGGQRDDDHDGYGNRCDAKFPDAPGALVNPYDLVQFRASNGKSRAGDNCGTTGTRPCAIFDLDESGTLIGSGDLTRFRLLNGKLPGAKCPTCPLTCTAGASGSCP